MMWRSGKRPEKKEIVKFVHEYDGYTWYNTGRVNPLFGKKS